MKMTTLEIIQAQTQILIEQERKIIELEDRLKRIENNQSASEEKLNYFTVLDYGIHKGIIIDELCAHEVNDKAFNLSKEKGIPINISKDTKSKMVNSYHESVLNEVIASML